MKLVNILLYDIILNYIVICGISFFKSFQESAACQCLERDRIENITCSNIYSIWITNTVCYLFHLVEIWTCSAQIQVQVTNELSDLNTHVSGLNVFTWRNHLIKIQSWLWTSNSQSIDNNPWMCAQKDFRGSALMMANLRFGSKVISPPSSHWNGIHHILEVVPWKICGLWGTQESHDSVPVWCIVVVFLKQNYVGRITIVF